MQQVDYLSAMVSAMPQPKALIFRDCKCLMDNHAFSSLYGMSHEKGQNPGGNEHILPVDDEPPVAQLEQQIWKARLHADSVYGQF